MSNKFVLSYQDLKKENKFLKGLIIGLVVCIFYCVALVSEDPIVIRESLDKIEFMDVNSSKLNEYDVEIFIRHFVDNFNLYDSYKIKDLNKSLSMMEDDLQQKFIRDVFTQQAIEKISQLNATTETEIQEISFEQQAESIKCVVIYTRKQEFFNTQSTKSHPIRLDLIISIQDKRTKNNPYGLLLSQIKRTKLV